MQEDEPAQVHLARRYPGHLPVQDRGRGEVPVHDVADAGVAPTQDRGVDDGRPVRVQPGERLLQHRDRLVAVGPPVVGAPAVDVSAQRGVAVGGEITQKGDFLGRRGEGVDARQGGDGRILQKAALIVGGVGEPVVAEGVRQDVRRYQTLDALHDEELRSEDFRVGFIPKSPRDRDRRAFADQRHDSELIPHPVFGEDGHGVGGRRQARHASGELRCTVRGRSSGRRTTTSRRTSRSFGVIGDRISRHRCRRSGGRARVRGRPAAPRGRECWSGAGWRPVPLRRSCSVRSRRGL